MRDEAFRHAAASSLRPNPKPILPKVADPSQRVWIFDLDNTLYPASCNLFAQIDARMQSFIATYLALSPDAARQLQKHYYRTYGTTLRGMMQEHGLSAEEFLGYVHEIDVSVVTPSATLAAALARLKGRKLIFTNGSARHAGNVTDRLGITQHFEAVFDIVSANYVPKPEPACFAAMVSRHEITPAAALMIEDLPRNLVPAAALGMTTLLIEGNHELTDIAADGAHIHQRTDDLVGWLEHAAAIQDKAFAG